MRKFTRAFWALLAAGLFAGIARADVFDVQRITAYGYRVLQPSGALGPIHPLGQGDLAVTISPENGFVYRAAATADSNQNRFRAEIPFGYRISRWMARYDSDRLDGSDIANSHGQPEIVVDWDGLGNMINLILVVEEDPIRHVTFAKSQFGEGTLWLDDGKNRHQVEPGVTNVTNGVSYDLEAVPATDPATGLNRSEFRRWEDGSTNYLRLVTIRSNETFCAEFMPSSWPVTFDPDAPEAVVRPRSKVVTWNSSYGKLPTPSRVGHEFVRWETPAGDRAEPSTKVLVAGPHVLQAVWKAVRHVITTLVEGSGTVEGGGTKDYGSMVELKAKPAEGHSFVGWDDGVTDNPRVLNVVGDAVYTALFSPCLYTVTFNYRGPNGEKKTEIRSDVRYHGHVDPPDPGAVTNWANHTFVAWDRSFERIESDLTVTAVYNAGTYFVRFEPNGGEGVMDTVAIMIDEDEALPPNTFTRERFHFLGWSEQAEATRAQYADKEVVRNIADENATNVLYAVWAHNLAYTIVYDANGGEGGTNQYVEIGSLSYLWGTNGFSRLGHLLAGWKTDATATTATYAPKANISKALGVDGDTVTLYAHWDPIRYTLRYDLNGGSGNPPEEVHEFNKNFAIWNLVLPPSGADSLYCWSRASDSVVPAPNGYAPGVTTNNLSATDGEVVTLYAIWQLKDVEVAKGLVYDGSCQTGVVVKGGCQIVGNVATNAGEYTATVTPLPGFVWADGSTNATNVVWTIAKGTKDVSGVTLAGETRVAWDGAEKTLAVEGVPAGVTATPSWSAPPVEPGTYTLTVSFAPTDAANWNAIAETKTATLTITAPVAVPTAVSGLVYDGNLKTGVVAAADAVYALAGNTATTAGVYAATATLPSGYAWTGGSTAPTNVAWTIAKGTYDMSGVAFASKTVGWTGESQSLDPVAGLPDGVTAVYSGETNRADIGVSTAKARFVVDDPANWNAVDLELTATLTVTANLPVPTAVPGLVYDGGAKTGVVAGAGYTLTGNVATNAGEYTATATLEPNYFWADGSSEPTNVVWTIAKGTKDVSGVMVAGETRVAWDGTEKTLAVEGVPAGVTATPSWSAPPVEPGTYTLTVSFAPTDAANWNAIAETKTATLTITAPVAVPTAVPGLVYDGTAKTGVVAAADAVYALAGNTATTAGVYAATATLRESGYAWAGGSTAPTNVAWTIAKGTYDLAGVTFASKTVAWTGESQSLDPVAGLPAGVTAVYSGETNRADIGVSTATARLTVDDPENWNAIDRELTATLTVTRNLPVPTAVLGLVYDGGAKTGVVAGAGYTLTGNVATNAGTYTATATLEPNYFWADGSSEPTNVVWTIAKGTKDVGGVTVAGETRVAWDGAEKTLAVAGVPTGVTATPSWSAPPVEPGTYTLTVSFAPTDAANWNAIAETKTATLTITAPVAVPTAVPGLVYDGTAKTGVVAAADAVYALSEHIAMNAGSYVATATLRESGYAWAGGLTAPTNVAWTIAKGTYDLTGVTFASKTNKYDGSVQTLDPVAGLPVGVTAVYSGEPSRRDVGVSTATVRFEVDDPANWNAIDLELTATLTVTGELPVPTAVPGLVYDGQAKTGVVAGVGYTLAGNVATNAGVYTATATLGDVYYWVGGSTEPTNVIWEIARGTKDVNGVTVQSPLTVPYDGREKTLTFGNLPSGVSASLSWDRQPVGPGEYHATVSFVADDPDNWTVVGGMEPVTLTITDSVAVPTAYDGLVYDGGAKTGVVVAADAVYALVGNVATNAGSYTATATLPAGYAWADGSTAPKNVAWTIAKGTYDLAGVTFASKTVGWTGESQSLDPVAGLPAGVTADYSGETNRTDVGVSTATARLTVDDPENWNAVDLELTATLTVTANLPVPTAVPNLVYDGGAKTGVVAGAGYTLAGNVATNAGTYAATATLEPNYFWADGASHPTNVTWTIARGRFDVQDVTFANAPLDYTGEALAPAIDGTLPPGVTMTFECATDRTSPGTHVVTVRFGADDNWELVGETRIVEMKIRSVIDVPNVADAFVYDGTAKTGVVAGVGYTLTGNVATNVGRYEVVATLLPGYEWSNKPGIKTEPWYADWVITKATYDMSGVTFESKTFDYDGQPHSLDPAGPLPPGLEAVYDGELGMTEAGERTVTASFKWDDQHTNNWNAIETTLTATLTIIQGGPVVTPGNWVPDGGDPVSYKGVYGVGLGNLAISLPSQGELVLEVRYAGDGSAEEEKFSVTPGQEGVVSDMSGSLKPDAGSNWKRLTIAVNKKGNLQFAYSYSDEFGNDTCWVRIVGWTPGGVQ